MNLEEVVRFMRASFDISNMRMMSIDSAAHLLAPVPGRTASGKELLDLLHRIEMIRATITVAENEVRKVIAQDDTFKHHEPAPSLAPVSLLADTPKISNGNPTDIRKISIDYPLDSPMEFVLTLENGRSAWLAGVTQCFEAYLKYLNGYTADGEIAWQNMLNAVMRLSFATCEILERHVQFSEYEGIFSYEHLDLCNEPYTSLTVRIAQIMHANNWIDLAESFKVPSWLEEKIWGYLLEHKIPVK